MIFTSEKEFIARHKELRDMLCTDVTMISDMVNDIVKTVNVRTQNEFGSIDVQRESTEDERYTLYRVIYGALVTFIMASHDLDIVAQAVADTAELTAMMLLPYGEEEHINCYTTVYNPLKRLMGAL